MLGFIRTLDTSHTGLRCPCTPHLAFCPRISWLRRVQIVWLQWSSQPWPPLWISHSRVTGPCVQSEPFAITWTGPQILGRTRSWSLSPSKKERQGTPIRPRYQLTRGLNRIRHEKDAMTSHCLDRKEVRCAA